MPDAVRLEKPVRSSKHGLKPASPPGIALALPTLAMLPESEHYEKNDASSNNMSGKCLETGPQARNSYKFEM
jgi:hypothetical protein